MRLTPSELEFLSAWAREEWEPACYQLPAHRLQLAHKVRGAWLIAFIKSWADAEGKRDQEVLHASVTTEPAWPWASDEDFRARLEEASVVRL